MISKLIIRWACIEDAHSLAEVHVASWQRAYRGIIPDSVLKDFTITSQEQRFRKVIAEKTGETAVIEEAGRVVGFTIIGPSRDDDTGAQNLGEIWGLYISPDHWRKGLGKRLTEWAIHELQSRGYDIVTLWVLERNVTAREFYEAMGFAPDGVTKEVRPGAPLAVRYRKCISGNQLCQ